MEETIRTYSGMIVGRIKTLPNGDKEVKNYTGVLLGYYRKDRDVTVDMTGRILYRGDMSAALLVLIK